MYVVYIIARRAEYKIHGVCKQHWLTALTELLSFPATAGADEDLAAAVGNQTPAAGGIVSVRASGGSANAAKSGGEGKKGSMLYAKQDSSKKRGRGTPSSAGKKGPKKQKK